MSKTVIRLQPKSAIRAYWRDHWAEKCGARFETNDFRRETYDHLTGGPPDFANWQFKRMAEVKADCYVDGMEAATKAIENLEQLAKELPSPMAEKLLHAAEKVRASVSHFTDAALVPGVGSSN